MNKIGKHRLWESVDSEFNIDYLKQQTSFNKSRLISRSYFSNFIAPTLGDRMEMASCLEGRAPLLDRDVLNFCYSLPEEYCFREDTYQGKKIMYDAFADIIPEHFAKIGKQPFRSPTNQSILKAEGGAQLYSELISRNALKKSGIFNPNTLGAIKLAWKLVPKSGATFRRIDMNMGYFMSVQALHHVFVENFNQFIDLNSLQYPMIERKWDF